jgi:hypothetical protein
MVQPNYDARMVAFDRAMEKKLEQYKEAVECKKLAIKTQELEVELYNKRSSENTISLENINNHRRFEIFV